MRSSLRCDHRSMPSLKIEQIGSSETWDWCCFLPQIVKIPPNVLRHFFGKAKGQAPLFGKLDGRVFTVRPAIEFLTPYNEITDIRILCAKVPRGVDIRTLSDLLRRNIHESFKHAQESGTRWVIAGLQHHEIPGKLGLTNRAVYLEFAVPAVKITTTPISAMRVRDRSILHDFVNSLAKRSGYLTCDSYGNICFLQNLHTAVPLVGFWILNADLKSLYTWAKSLSFFFNSKILKKEVKPGSYIIVNIREDRHLFYTIEFEDDQEQSLRSFGFSGSGSMKEILTLVPIAIPNPKTAKVSGAQQEQVHHPTQQKVVSFKNTVGQREINFMRLREANLKKGIGFSKKSQEQTFLKEKTLKRQIHREVDDQTEPKEVPDAEQTKTPNMQTTQTLESNTASEKNTDINNKIKEEEEWTSQHKPLVEQPPVYGAKEQSDLVNLNQENNLRQWMEAKLQSHHEEMKSQNEVLKSWLEKRLSLRENLVMEIQKGPQEDAGLTILPSRNPVDHDQLVIQRSVSTVDAGFTIIPSLPQSERASKKNAGQAKHQNQGRFREGEWNLEELDETEISLYEPREPLKCIDPVDIVFTDSDEETNPSEQKFSSEPPSSHESASCKIRDKIPSSKPKLNKQEVSSSVAPSQVYTMLKIRDNTPPSKDIEKQTEINGTIHSQVKHTSLSQFELKNSASLQALSDCSDDSIMRLGVIDPIIGVDWLHFDKTNRMDNKDSMTTLYCERVVNGLEP